MTMMTAMTNVLVFHSFIHSLFLITCIIWVSSVTIHKYMYSWFRLTLAPWYPLQNNEYLWVDTLLTCFFFFFFFFFFFVFVIFMFLFLIFLILSPLYNQLTLPLHTIHCHIPTVIPITGVSRRNWHLNECILQ
jgi:hypothetical protein